jgi:hypothetical protein
MNLDFGQVVVPLEITDEIKAVLRKHCGEAHSYAQVWTELINAAQHKVVYVHPDPSALTGLARR